MAPPPKETVLCTFRFAGAVAATFTTGCKRVVRLGAHHQTLQIDTIARSSDNLTTLLYLAVAEG